MPLIRRRVISGEPIRVGQKQIVPEARLIWWMQRRALVGMNSASGWGAGMVSIRPAALIEQGPDGMRRLPVRDETARMLLGLAAGMVFVSFLAEIAVRLATNRGGRKR